ncbi:MAG: hypothetical protein ACI4NM_08750 [Bullifex sp.]
MKRNDKVLLGVNIAFTLLITVMTVIFLPEKISLMLSGGPLKSRLYLPLLSAVPLACTYIVSVTGKSSSISYAFLLGVMTYCVCVYITALGHALPYEALVLLILSICSATVAVLLLSPGSRVKVSLKYVTDRYVYERLQKLASVMFFTISAELLLIALLSFLGIAFASAAIFAVLITGFIFALGILKASIKA